MKPLYFGCVLESGHFAFGVDLRSDRRHKFSNWLENNDGMFPPPNIDQAQGIARLIEFEDFTVLAFWDRSIDHRPGSHSTFLLPGGDLTFDEALRRAGMYFPTVWNRYKFAVTEHKSAHKNKTGE